jgi:hypothetical protein
MATDNTFFALPDHVLIQKFLDFLGFIDFVLLDIVSVLLLFAGISGSFLQQIMRVLDTLVAYVAFHTGKENVHLTFLSVTKGTFPFILFCHAWLRFHAKIGFNVYCGC